MAHTSELTWFCVAWGRSLQCLRGMNQTDCPNMLQQCIQYFIEAHLYAGIVDMMSSVYDVKISLRLLKCKLDEARIYQKRNTLQI